ncbi:hypothetical protein AB0O74_32635 [Streptomyces rubiginosohelvolus]|uniref:hypothetical protein n=1 Tax=Streptomyces rubiginosohelvolus TaxID=67362 RepID=UPI003422C81D
MKPGVHSPGSTSPAPWLLGDDTFVHAHNTAYERVYPRALERLGTPHHALSDEQAWSAWLHTLHT